MWLNKDRSNFKQNAFQVGSSMSSYLHPKFCVASSMCILAVNDARKLIVSYCESCVANAYGLGGVYGQAGLCIGRCMGAWWW